jgi:hypothetical protein
MNCQEYLSLDSEERFVLLGKVIHLLQNDPESFEAMSSMVRSATQKGIFEKVKIGRVEMREFPCKECETGEYIHVDGPAPSTGTMRYECNNCGHSVSFP